MCIQGNFRNKKLFPKTALLLSTSNFQFFPATIFAFLAKVDMLIFAKSCDYFCEKAEIKIKFYPFS